MLLAKLGLILILIGCGGSNGGSNFALRNVAWMPADSFHTVDIGLIDYAASLGIGGIGIEHFPTLQEHEGRNWRKGDMLQSYPAIAQAWNKRACDNGQFFIVFGINWNVLPFRNQTDEWAEGVFNEIARIYDPACTYLEAIIEPDEGDLRKAERWAKIAERVWKGKMLVPARGAHWPVRRDFVDFHPNSVEQAQSFLSKQNQGTIVITDGGPFVHPLSVIQSIPNLVQTALANNIIFVLYTDRYSPDTQGHRVVIESLTPF